MDLGLNDFQLSSTIVQVMEYKQKFIQATIEKDWRTLGGLCLLSVFIAIGAFYTTPFLVGLAAPLVAGVLGVPAVCGQWLATLLVASTTRKVIKKLEKIVIQ